MTKQKKDWGPYRLGHKRRLCHQYSHAHRLFSGLNADDTQLIKGKRKLIRKLMIMHIIFRNKSRRIGVDQDTINRYNRLSRLFLTVSVIKMNTIRNMLIPLVPVPRPMNKDGRHIRINTFIGKDVECLLNFHYSTDELNRIVACLQLPHFLVLNADQDIKHQKS
jgi:hypothetical protein